MKQLLTMILGVIFALGLGISEMTRPQKILAFLDIFGDWDPSLLIVMGSALVVYYILQKWIRGRLIPLYSPVFTLPKQKGIETKQMLGAAFFGIGWGMVGFCPGPVITASSTLIPGVLVFLPALITGIYLSKYVPKG